VRAIVFYLWKSVWPQWLSPYYPLQGTIGWAQPDVLISLVVFTAVTGLAVATAKRTPLLLTVWVSCLLWLLPVSGLLQSGPQSAADRYMYLPLVSLLILGAIGGQRLWKKFGVSGRLALGILPYAVADCRLAQ
jgi:hypothetical protein